MNTTRLAPVVKSDWEIRQEAYHIKVLHKLLPFLESTKWESGNLAFPAGKLHIIDLREFPDMCAFMVANPTCGWEHYGGIRWKLAVVDELRNLYVEAEYWVY